MITSCPHCSENLNFTKEQEEKLKNHLLSLQGKQQVRITCPSCQKGIILDRSAAEPEANERIAVPEPPPPPELEWLMTGAFAGTDTIEDVPMALIVYPPSRQRDDLSKSFESLGYLPVVAENPEEAIDKIQYTTFSCVLFKEDLEDDIETSVFHTYMCTMPVSKRREMIYIIIGKERQTLYNIEALSLSCNLVINEAETGFIELLLRKAIPDYEDLFGPFLNELNVIGKR